MVSPILNIANFDYQLKNFFELKIEDNDPDPNKSSKFGWFYQKNFKFMIIDTNLSFPKFEVSQFQGKHFAKSRLFDSQTFYFTIYENTNFDTLLYFEDWINKIYDSENRVYNSFASEEEYINICERNFHLKFKKFPNSLNISNVLQDTLEVILYSVKILDRGDFDTTYKEGDPISYKINCVYDDYKIIPLNQRG